MPHKFLKSISLIAAMLILAGCATAGKNRFKDLFEDELAQNRQSIKFGSVPKAVEELTMLLEMDPKNEEARFLRALAYQKMEHFDKAFKTRDAVTALKHFDRFISLEPDHPRVFTAAKIMLSLDGAASSDQDNLKDLIRDTLADREVSRIATGDGNGKDAIKKLEKAIELKPTCAKCHRALADILKDAGRKEEAQIHLVKAGLFDPNNSAKE
jgi:Flp pilus assembly protein TadD